MSDIIKELRKSTGLTQKAFADTFDIPLSTLKKWEQGEASPPYYVVRLISKSLPVKNKDLIKIETKSATFFYDSIRKTVSDTIGNTINIQTDLSEVKPNNLELYLQDLFNTFYEMQEKFNRDCQYDKEEDIIWVNF